MKSTHLYWIVTGLMAVFMLIAWWLPGMACMARGNSDGAFGD